MIFQIEDFREAGSRPPFFVPRTIFVLRVEQVFDSSRHGFRLAFEEGFDTIQINGNNSDNNFAIGQSGSTLIISEGTGSLSISGDALGFAAGSILPTGTFFALKDKLLKILLNCILNYTQKLEIAVLMNLLLI